MLLDMPSHKMVAKTDAKSYFATFCNNREYARFILAAVIRDLQKITGEVETLSSQSATVCRTLDGTSDP